MRPENVANFIVSSTFFKSKLSSIITYSQTSFLILVPLIKNIHNDTIKGKTNHHRFWSFFDKTGIFSLQSISTLLVIITCDQAFFKEQARRDIER